MTMLHTEAQRRKRSEGGFTLVELLVVIVIIGILAAVAVFAVGGITDKGEEAACDATANSVRTAAEAYRAQQDGYAPTLADLDPNFIRLDDLTLDEADADTIVTDGGNITYAASGDATDDGNFEAADVTDTCVEEEEEG